MYGLHRRKKSRRRLDPTRTQPDARAETLTIRISRRARSGFRPVEGSRDVFLLFVSLASIFGGAPAVDYSLVSDFHALFFLHAMIMNARLTALATPTAAPMAPATR